MCRLNEGDKMPEQDKTIDKILDSFIHYEETKEDKMSGHMQSLGKEIVSAVKEIKQPDINITVPEIKIPEIKIPEVVVNERPIKDITVTGFLKWGASVIELLGALLKKKIDLSFITKDNPLPVVLTHDGKFYKAVDKILTSVSTSPTIFNLKNSSGTVINPATSDKQDTGNTLLGGIAGLVPTAYDYVSLSYTGDNLTGVIFKTGGAGGTTIATLTLAYTGSNLTSVTKT